MNIEQLCRFVKQNFEILPNKVKALKFVKYHFNLLAWKRGKLKLGAIVFDVKEIKVHTFVVWEEIEIRFIRQDTSIADEQKLENVLKRLGWQWDLRNYIALIVVIVLVSVVMYNLLYDVYADWFPALAIRPEAYDDVLEKGFEICFNSVNLDSFQRIKIINFWLVDVLSRFCSHYNLVL